MTQLQLAGGEPLVQQRGLGKTAHPHRVVDHRAGRIAQPRLSGAATDWNTVKVQIWRQTTIQPQFLFTVVFPPGQTGKIEKTQIQGLFDFIGIVAGQQNMRNMGLQMVDLRHRLWITRWLQQRRNQRRLVIGLMGLHGADSGL